MNAKLNKHSKRAYYILKRVYPVISASRLEEFLTIWKNESFFNPLSGDFSKQFGEYPRE